MLNLNELQGLSGGPTFAQHFGIELDEYREFLDKGLFLLEQGTAEEAVALFEALVVLNPLSFRAWFLLGRSYERAGRRQDAHLAFRQALERDPNSADAKRARARTAA